jgi:class 3 adenylate cyclase
MSYTRPKAVATLPDGTVTLLFSDIEGSTRILRAIGVKRYENALQQHRLLLRAAFETWLAQCRDGHDDE